MKCFTASVDPPASSEVMAMNDTQHKLPEAQGKETCAKPEIREYLSVYIINPIEDPFAKMVEDHFLECRDCREFFLMMLSVRGDSRRAKSAGAGQQGGASSEGQVVRLDDFRKEWP